MAASLIVRTRAIAVLIPFSLKFSRADRTSSIATPNRLKFGSTASESISPFPFEMLTIMYPTTCPPLFRNNKHAIALNMV